MPPIVQIRAVNTAADSENRIHDNRIAASYGFGGGLVPGVTVFGYMAYAVIRRFGESWLEKGSMDVRFFQPFYEGEQVEVEIVELEQGRIKVEAAPRAAGTAWMDSAAHDLELPPAQSLADRVEASRETILPGIVLGTIEKILDLSQPGMAAPLDAWIGAQRFAQPAVLLALANEILVRNYTLGPWIHTASEVRNARPARDGEHLHVRGKIVDAYERKGHELVVLDVAILSGDALVSRIRHTAIWKLRS